jgi:hypothetical protein
MHLIDDIDFVFSLIWFESSLLDEISDIVDSGIGCCIYLDDIEHGSVIECETVCTFMTGIPISEIDTIHPLGKDTRTRRLTRSTRTMKEVCMSHAVVCECIAEDSLDAILSDDRIPIPRTILGVE